MSERALPTQIPLNPRSVAAECVVPPRETLPKGLITEHPVCVKPKWLLRCLLHNGCVVWAWTRFCPHRCDAVHKPGTPSSCSPQLLLSFAATTLQFQPYVCSSWLCNYPGIRGFGGLTKTFLLKAECERAELVPSKENMLIQYLYKLSWNFYDDNSLGAVPFISTASLFRVQQKHVYI